MLIINLETCSSTQSYLKDMLVSNEKRTHERILVTAKNQTSGRGRGNKDWKTFDHAICMSCLLPATIPFTLNPLKIGALVANFFSKKFELEIRLKWPNDIIDSNGKKVGGILCQLHKNKILAGIGINLFANPEYEKQPFICSGLQINQDILNKNEITLELYEYLIENYLLRFSIENYHELCCHMEKGVEIKDEFSSTEGIFKGVTDQGEALIYNDGKMSKVLTGSLIIR